MDTQDNNLTVSHADTPNSGYSYYVVAMLMLAYMLSFIDRIILSLLIEPIKAEFALSDTQIGLVVGFGFVLFYAFLGLPFGVIADKANRKLLILFGVVGWGLATSLSGLAGGFLTLFLARAAVGIGEATLSPSAISTIGDRFDRNRLGFAVAIYSAGVSLGAGLALAFGGILADWANQHSFMMPGYGVLTGWRLAMVIVGAICIPFAILFGLTVREAPRRGQSEKAPAIGVLVSHILANAKSFTGVFFGYSFAVIASYIPLLWAPALLIRDHDMTPSQVGMAMGGIVGIAGLVGMLSGGIVSDALAKRGVKDAPVRVVIFAVVAQGPFFAAAYVLESLTLVLVLLTFGVFFMSLFGSLQATTIQVLTPPRMRGRMYALYLLFATLIGMGLGPLLIGLLSDYALPSLGLSLSVVSTISLLIAFVVIILCRPSMHRTITSESIASEAT